MTRSLLFLFFFAAVGAFAQIGNGDSSGTYPPEACEDASVNPKTYPISGITYPIALCVTGVYKGAPQLHDVVLTGTHNGLQLYDLYTAVTGSQTPSICFGSPEPFDRSTNSFLPSATGRYNWVQVCRPVAIDSVRYHANAADETVIRVSTPMMLSLRTDPSLPAAMQKPIVMLTNNESGKSTIASVNVPNHPYTAPSETVVQSVSPLGYYSGSGLPRYQIFASKIGWQPPTVQLLSGTWVALDASGIVQSRTPFAVGAAAGNVSGQLLAWLPVPVQPQVVESTTTYAIIQASYLNAPVTPGMLQITAPVSGGSVPPPTVMRGFFINNDTQQSAEFSLVP